MSLLACLCGCWGQRVEITGFPVCTAVSCPSISKYTQSRDSLTSSWTHISSLMLPVKHKQRPASALSQHPKANLGLLKLPAWISQSASYRDTVRASASAITEKQQSNESKKQKQTSAHLADAKVQDYEMQSSGRCTCTPWFVFHSSRTAVWRRCSIHLSLCLAIRL